jgi:hypothetical protein
LRDKIFFIDAVVGFCVGWGYGQAKECPFSFKSIARPDNMLTKQLVKTIDSLPLQTSDQATKIPGFIKEVLNCWSWKNNWSIADRGQAFNATDMVDLSLPMQQLLYLGLNKNYMLIAYKHGGLASNCPVLLFRFENEQIISIMYWSTFNEKMKGKRDVIKTLKRHKPDPYGELHM